MTLRCLLNPWRFKQCVIAIDIDHFKNINDTFGHDKGDLVLVSLASLLKQSCRPNDIVSRSGGEEFILLLPNMPLAEGMATAERIRQAVYSAIFPGVGKMTISAGVAVFNGPDGAREEGLHYADKALYQSKRNGRNRVSISETGGIYLTL
ncbi:GGDEF domain-containing protein [Pantoea ananatis]|uniref:GGDEF domain-containing protein n=1 Tax=Pantoea ananas TaxID=553 RepID=UPI00158E4E76|nr:GGDEF domain-containing protein [Pantoea ananatis]MBA4823481.1 GGDEF domain-containing protein [Pantoea ananatis]QKV88016.1 GGDEF domain-containing protein [Pantoea ananatis]